MRNKIEFSEEVLKNLKKSGYTHIYSRGIQNEHNESDNDFILVPLKPTDPRITFEESDLNIQKIDSSDIEDMIHGDPFIRFVVDITDL